MTDSINQAVTISVDLKKSRIRIYKSMIHMLGDPKYIQLLVNPHNKHVAIRAIDESISGDQSERVKPHDMMADNSFELYSKMFVKKLSMVAGNLESNCTYRLTGTIVPSHKMAIFSMNTLKRVEI